MKQNPMSYSILIPCKCVTGSMIDAHQAERDGLVSKVVPVDKVGMLASQ